MSVPHTLSAFSRLFIRYDNVTRAVGLLSEVSLAMIYLTILIDYWAIQSTECELLNNNIHLSHVSQLANEDGTSAEKQKFIQAFFS